MTKTNDIKKKTIFIGKTDMLHFEGGKFGVTGTLWGDHFNGLEVIITQYATGIIDVDVYLENMLGYILALHDLTKITFGPQTSDYNELMEVVFDGE